MSESEEKNIPALRESIENTEGGDNASLLLNRYLKNAVGTDKENEGKNELFKRVNGAMKNDELYKTAYNRWKISLPKNSVFKIITTDGKMIIGLGNDNVLETGITLHHTYGVPYIPGTALKGLAAHYCHSVWGEKDDKFKKGGEYHKLIFGTTESAGFITFFDAWIQPDKVSGSLVKDVMTPHHTEYYSGKDKDTPPSDFDSPTPVGFLSVHRSFCIALSCDNTDNEEEAKKLIELTFKLLKDALENWGIGGKTSSGYGRLVFNEEETEKEKSNEKQSEREANTPKFQLWFEEEGNKFTSKNEQQKIVNELKNYKDQELKDAVAFISSKIKKKERVKGLQEIIVENQ